MQLTDQQRSERRYPTSAAQRRLWFIARMYPDSCAYNNAHAIRFSGELDSDRLARALRAVVARHEPLRARFEASDDEDVVACIAPEIDLAMPLVDLRNTLPTDLPQIERRCIAKLASAPFDLAMGPPIRTTLLHLSDNEYVLTIVVHHIVFDRWSFGVFVNDLAAIYRALGEPDAPTLDPIRTTYGECVRERGRGNAALERDLAFWHDAALGDVPALDMTTDAPRPAMPSFKGSVHTRTLERDLVARITALAAAHRATAFMAYVGAFCALLARYTGQADFLIGTPVAGRTRVEEEPLVGLFINTLPLRIRPSLTEPFSALLANVRRDVLDLLAHQSAPLDLIVRDVLDTRDPSRHPLFDVSFNYHNVPYDVRFPEELAARSEDVDLGVSRLDIMLVMRPLPDGRASCRFEYATDIYTADTIERLGSHFVTLLEAIVVAPDVHLGDLSLITPVERERIVTQWSVSDGTSGLSRPFERDASLHELVERQVARRPNARAIVEDGVETLTYGELDRRAALIAQTLRRRGVSRDVPVGIFLERSAAAVVAMYAILKAGGGYVPLDPSYPIERTRYMLAASGAHVVITCGDLRATAGELDATIVDLDDLDVFDDLDAAPVEAAAINASRADALAYVIFTSGSSGRPKGVEIVHRGIVALVTGTGVLALDETDVTFLHGALTFDVATQEIWSTLVSGARLVVAPERQSLAEFGATLRRHAITRLDVSAASFHQLVDEQLDDLRGLRQFFVGGDVLSPDHVARFVAAVPSCRFFNAYGPTECTVNATIHRVEPDARIGRTVPIGRPVAGTRAYILDTRRHPVPQGIPGELYIGGDGLARGYIGDPARTAERFVDDPFGPPGSRLYRTGDRARWLDGGSIEFLGRIDGQVKIRGFRIEPAEIEFTLVEHPGVVRAAVTTQHAASTEDRILVAYVESRDPTLDESALRTFLHTKLPAHAIPARIVALAKLPLTSGGKIDRTRLPAPLEAVRDCEETPFDDREAAVAEILQRLLRCERIGRHDEFFALGGHSLLALRAIARIADSFGTELSVRAFFLAPSVAGLAALLPPPRLPRSTAASLDAEGSDDTTCDVGAVALSYEERRLWIAQQLEPNAATYNVSLVRRIRGNLSVSALERSLQQIVMRHDVLRSTYALVDGEPMRSVAASDLRELVRVDIAGPDAIARLNDVLDATANRAFELATEPPLRTLLVRLEDAEHVLLVTMHHIVTDGWSVGIFNRELGAFYSAFVDGRPSMLAPLKRRYADFAARQRASDGSARNARNIRYWKDQLCGAPDRLALPGARRAASRSASEGAVVIRTCSPALGPALAEFQRAHKTTLFPMLLATFATLLFQSTGNRDIVVGSPLANRTQADFDDVIGFFVNTMVFRVRIVDDPSFIMLLREVRNTVLAGYEHGDVSFDRVVEVAAPVRTTNRMPLVNALFVLQDASRERPRLTGLAVDVIPLERVQAILDFVFEVRETEEGLRLSIVYRKELFDGTALATILARFETLLEAIVREPQTTISRLAPIEDEFELPLDGCRIHDAFEAQARRVPDRIAIVDDKDAVTYAGLDRRANRLARHLEALGVRPRVYVGVALDGSLACIVAFLAVLKVGAAYVPLDPRYPQERIEHVIGDANIEFVITRRSAVDASFASARCVDLDEAAAQIDALPSDARPVAGTSDDPAYLMYTSGSTGTPKGVIVPHRGVRRLVTKPNYVRIGEDDRIALTSTVAFDASTFEIWGALLNGARLTIFPKPVLLSPPAFAAKLVTDGVTIVFLTTSLFGEIVRQVPTAFRHLTYLLVGGETLGTQPVRALFEGGPPTHVINAYGPTEATTFATYHEIATLPGVHDTIPIGRAISHTDLYLLDDNRTPVRDGDVGELYIGGPGLALGYLNDSELTQRKFVHDPFGNGDSDAILYATGDLVRRLPAGEVEHIGRRDGQLKRRGFRIDRARSKPAFGRFRMCATRASCFAATGPRLSSSHTRSSTRQTGSTLPLSSTNCSVSYRRSCSPMRSFHSPRFRSRQPGKSIVRRCRNRRKRSRTGRLSRRATSSNVTSRASGRGC